MKRINLFKKDLEAKKAVKIIAGIDNFDIDRVRSVVIAADRAGASAVDVSANEEIIKMAKETTSLPVFVSSIVPEDLAMAVKAGADAIEIGNFDALYKKGMRMSAMEILDIVKETLALIGKSNVFVCVTVPGHIDVCRNKKEMKFNALPTDLFSPCRVCLGEPGPLSPEKRMPLCLERAFDLAWRSGVPDQIQDLE